MAQGGKFKHGFFAGAFASMAGSGMEASKWGVFSTDAGQLVTAAVVGGTASELGGGKFANGAVTGAYTMLFNHMAHQKQEKSSQKPDWNKLSDSEKTKYFLEAAKNSETLQVNVHDIFDNFTPQNSNGTYQGFRTQKPVIVLLGNKEFTVTMDIPILVNKNGGYNSIINMEISDPQLIIKSPRGGGSGYGYNYGYRSNLYLWIKGDNNTRRAFEKWYGY